MCKSVEEALHQVRQHDGRPEDLELAIATEVLDAAGINMAIVTDAILDRGWMPDGFEERGSYRLYRFATAD